MEKSKKAGALKSWTCVAMLTFFIPAAGFELSTLLFSASAVAGQTISHYFEPAEAASSPLVVSCDDKLTDVSDEII